MRKSGKMIKEAREANGVSQLELSQRLGYKSPQMISNFERGLCSVPIAQADKLAKTLGMSSDSLIRQIVEEKISISRERSLR